jgi:hypothetical protein
MQHPNAGLDNFKKALDRVRLKSVPAMNRKPRPWEMLKPLGVPGGRRDLMPLPD